MNTLNFAAFFEYDDETVTTPSPEDLERIIANALHEELGSCAPRVVIVNTQDFAAFGTQMHKSLSETVKERP